MPPKFLEQLKASDWINLGTNVVGGLASGKASARSAEQDWFRQQQDARQAEFNRQLALYNAQLQARSGLGAFYGQTAADRARAAEVALGAMPLGAEQNLAMQMARARGLSGVAETFQPLMPASADIAGLIRPTSNVLSAFTTPDFRASISPEATARSIAERRKAIAGVNPTFQFGSMGDYGVPNLEKEVATYAQGVAADRLSRENQLLDLLTKQMQAASALPTTAQTAMAGVAPSMTTAPPQAAQPKKSSWWKKVLNVAATAAPIVAAPFTGGTSLALIGAGSGALKGALSGGAKGALTGAAMGAATSAIGGGAAGEAAKRGISEGVKESASAAIKRAILNPRALTQLGGAAVGGQAEQVAQLVSPFLPGAKAYVPRQTGPRPMGPGATVSSPLYDRIGPAGQSLPPTGSVTPPDLSGRTPTPTGSGTLGGFRRAGNLFPGMGPAQAQQPFIPMQTPGIQSQLTSPLPTAAPAAPQAGIRVPLRGVNGNLPPVTTLTIPASEFFFGPRPPLAPSEGRLPNGQWNIFGQTTVPLPTVNFTSPAPNAAQVSAGMPASTGDDSAVVANRAAMYELMYANPAQPQIVVPPVAPSPVPASANMGNVPRFNFGSGISTQAPNVSGLRWFGKNIPTPAVGPATMPVSTRGAQRIGAPISNPAMDVNMITPDGTVVVVPFSRMSEALSLGLRFALGR